MQKSELRLIKNAIEFLPQEEISSVPHGTRGIYVLYKRRGPKSAESHHFDFVYIGMASGGIKGRLKQHIKHKGGYWTHFSAFEVWDNISDDEIQNWRVCFDICIALTARQTRLTSRKLIESLD